MAISLSPEIQRLIEERMRDMGLQSADDFVRAAIDALDRTGETDDLDKETWAAIDRAEAEYQQGGGIPLDEAFTRLRKKYTDK